MKNAYRAAGRTDEARQAKEKLIIEGLVKVRGGKAGILEERAKVMLAPSEIAAAGSAVAMGMWGIILHPSKLVAGGVGISLLGAHQLAELYTSDTGRRWITTMMRMSADDPRVPALAARGVQLAAHALAIQPAVQKKEAAAMGVK